jgi:4'-phosphopantetheinyl transferase
MPCRPAAVPVPAPGELHLWWIEPDGIGLAAGSDTTRSVLASYLGTDPGGVAIAERPGGKPVLADGRWPDLRFNLSHEEGRAVLAVAAGREVGVDLQAIDPGLPADLLAGRVLSAVELVRYHRAAPADRLAAVLRAWVRTEAVLKATGSGLRVEPGEVVVGDDGRGGARLWQIGSDRRAGSRWSVFDLAAPWPGVLASAAWAGHPPRKIVAIVESMRQGTSR